MIETVILLLIPLFVVIKTDDNLNIDQSHWPNIPLLEEIEPSIVNQYESVILKTRDAIEKQLRAARSKHNGAPVYFEMVPRIKPNMDQNLMGDNDDVDDMFSEDDSLKSGKVQSVYDPIHDVRQYAIYKRDLVGKSAPDKNKKDEDLFLWNMWGQHPFNTQNSDLDMTSFRQASADEDGLLLGGPVNLTGFNHDQKSLKGTYNYTAPRQNVTYTFLNHERNHTTSGLTGSKGNNQTNGRNLTEYSSKIPLHNGKLFQHAVKKDLDNITEPLDVTSKPYADYIPSFPEQLLQPTIEFNLPTPPVLPTTFPDPVQKLPLPQSPQQWAERPQPNHDGLVIPSMAMDTHFADIMQGLRQNLTNFETRFRPQSTLKSFEDHQPQFHFNEGQKQNVWNRFMSTPAFTSLYEPPAIPLGTKLQFEDGLNTNRDARSRYSTSDDDDIGPDSFEVGDGQDEDSSYETIGTFIPISELSPNYINIHPSLVPANQLYYSDDPEYRNNEDKADPRHFHITHSHVFHKHGIGGDFHSSTTINKDFHHHPLRPVIYQVGFDGIPLPPDTRVQPHVPWRNPLISISSQKNSFSNLSPGQGNIQIAQNHGSGSIQQGIATSKGVVQPVFPEEQIDVRGGFGPQHPLPIPGGNTQNSQMAINEGTGAISQNIATARSDITSATRSTSADVQPSSVSRNNDDQRLEYILHFPRRLFRFKRAIDGNSIIKNLEDVIFREACNDRSNHHIRKNLCYYPIMDHRLSKRSLPLVRLATDPNAKLDMEKTLENVGTIARSSFEDKRAPLYHIQNMLGSSRNAMLSALKTIPQNFIIPSRYQIVDTSRDIVMSPEQLQAMRQEIMDEQKPIVEEEHITVTDTPLVAKPKTLLERLSKYREEQQSKLKALKQKLPEMLQASPLFQNRFANPQVGRDQPSDIDFGNTFQRMGSIVRDSVKSGQETAQHITDALQSARKVWETAKLGAPRILLPYGKAPVLEKQPLFGDGSRLTLIAPRIFDVDQDNLMMPNPADYRPEFVKVGDIMNAIGISNPNGDKVGLKRIIIQKNKPNPLVQSRFGQSKMPDIMEAIPKKLYVISEDIDDGAIDSGKLGRTLEAVKGITDVLGSTSLKDFVVELKNGFQSFKQDVKDMISGSKDQEVAGSAPLSEEEEWNGFLKELFSKEKEDGRKVEQDDILGMGLNLPPNLLRPFMDQPTKSDLDEFFRDNGDSLEDDNDVDDETIRDFFKFPINSPVLGSRMNNDVKDETFADVTDAEERYAIKFPEKLLKPYMGKLDVSEEEDFGQPYGGYYNLPYRNFEFADVDYDENI